MLSPLRQGSSGTAVRTIQRQLNRIAQNYPSFGTLTVDGNFGSGTAEVVRRFQRQFNLTADGVVGYSTWYKISYVYVSVKRLAELSGVSRVTITAVKSGKSCNEATAHKLAQVLGPNIIKEEV